MSSPSGTITRLEARELPDARKRLAELAEKARLSGRAVEQAVAEKATAIEDADAFAAAAERELRHRREVERLELVSASAEARIVELELELAQARLAIVAEVAVAASVARRDAREKFVASPAATAAVRYAVALDREDAALTAWREAAGELAGASHSDVRAARAAAAEAHARLVGSPTAGTAEGYRSAVSRIPRAMGGAYPEGFADDGDDPTDLQQRLELLTLPPRQPAKASTSAAVDRTEAEARAREARIDRAVRDSLAGLSTANGLVDPEERDEAIRRWHERHDLPRARQLERLGSARTER